MSTPSSRRQFLATTGALTLGAGLGPSVRAHPTGLKKQPIGHGDFQYLVDPKWGDLDPLKHPLQHCHEMVLDSRDRLVLSSVSNQHEVLVYNKDGKLLDKWHNDLPEPHGFSKAGEGEDQTFWLTDCTAGRVINYDLDGRIIRELDPPRDALGAKDEYKPTETTVAPDGSIYVADGYGTQKIYHYDAKGQLQHAFGGKDNFKTAHGIVLDERTETPTLLITSRSAQNFQRWSLDGEHLMTRELPGLEICRPVIHGDHTYFAVIVTDSWWSYDGMVAVLDKDFNIVSLPGGSAPTNQEDFQDVVFDNQTFMNPHDVCVDGDDNVYVCQWYSGRTTPIRLRRV